MNGLYLHCGSDPAQLSTIANAFTPQPTETHHPIPHKDFLETVENGLSGVGLTIDKRSYGLSHDDNRMFSLFELSRDNGENGTFKNVLGIRNAHDKAFSAGLVCGSKVFVCDNLAFSGEIKMNRKHTTHIMRDLPALVYGMIGKVVDGWLSQECRYEGYQDTKIEQEQADQLIGSVLRNKALPAGKHDKVLEEWNKPQHEEFEPRTAWSMFNAFTEVMKSAPRQLPARSIKLHQVFDEFCNNEIQERMNSRGLNRPTDFQIDQMEDATITGELGLTYKLS